MNSRSDRGRKKSAAAKPACPICGNPAQDAYRPFCSSRCRTLDLARWLDGAYAVPAVEADEGAEEEEGGEPDGFRG